MSEKTVTLSGWKLVVGLIVVGGVALFRLTTAQTKLDTQGRAALERWVQAELIRPIVADKTQSLAQQGAALEQASSVTIRSLAVRGPLSDAVMRVELAPSPALAPGTDLVRYYLVRYSVVSGWIHRGRTNVLRWDLAALPF
jgi:hypothetical protein